MAGIEVVVVLIESLALDHRTFGLFGCLHGVDAHSYSAVVEIFLTDSSEGFLLIALADQQILDEILTALTVLVTHLPDFPRTGAPIFQ